MPSSFRADVISKLKSIGMSSDVIDDYIFEATTDGLHEIGLVDSRKNLITGYKILKQYGMFVKYPSIHIMNHHSSIGL